MDEALPLVSIGLPVCNGERYLSEALDSLLSQTYRNIEIIISDNASTDSTPAVCAMYARKDSRVRYYRNEKNLGAARNYNLTVEHARGKYFKWAAHDDICKPTLIEECVAVLERESNVCLAYPKTIIIGPTGEPIDTAFEDRYMIRDALPHHRFRRFTYTPLDCNAVFGVMRLDLLRRTPCIGPYESSDRVLLGELALLGEIAEVPERLFLRRFHPAVSTIAARSKKDIARWFDPNASGRFTRLRRFVEYLRAIWRVPLTPYQRMYCLFFLLLFYVRMYGNVRRWVAALKNIRPLFDFSSHQHSLRPLIGQIRSGRPT